MMAYLIPISRRQTCSESRGALCMSLYESFMYTLRQDARESYAAAGVGSD